MKKLDIKITKASLKGFAVTFDTENEKINVTASIGLMTEGGKEITDYTIQTNAWSQNNKFELPISCINPILKIGQELEYVVSEHCMDSILKLEAPKYD